MLIILDRDGVINYDSAEYIKSPAEWIPIDGSLAAIKALCQAGHTVAVATNQSGIQRGYYTQTTLEQIHLKMRQAVLTAGGELALIVSCPHGPNNNCDCRKPKPGLLLEIMKKLHCHPPINKAIVVGDSIRDIRAARAANCTPVLVLTGNGKKTLKQFKDELQDIEIFSDLAKFAKQLTL